MVTLWNREKIELPEDGARSKVPLWRGRRGRTFEFHTAISDLPISPAFTRAQLLHVFSVACHVFSVACHVFSIACHVFSVACHVFSVGHFRFPTSHFERLPFYASPIFPNSSSSEKARLLLIRWMASPMGWRIASTVC